MKRIEKFLLQEDIDPNNVQSDPHIGEIITFLLQRLFGEIIRFFIAEIIHGSKYQKLEKGAFHIKFESFLLL